MARPRIKVDTEAVVKLASIGCTTSEIASIVNCSKDTLERRYAAELNKGRENGKTRLRRLMWQSAEKGNVVIQIWLSKNLLGYSDKQEISTPDDAPKLVLAYSLPAKGPEA